MEIDNMSSQYKDSDYFSQILTKLNEILQRIDTLEKTYVSMNSDLINQNIRMSEIAYDKLQEPMPLPSGNNSDTNSQNEINNSVDKEKELYYYENNNKIIVHGPGTYDNRPILKRFGEWNSVNKTWDLSIIVETLLEKFPNIIQKEK